MLCSRLHSLTRNPGLSNSSPPTPHVKCVDVVEGFLQDGGRIEGNPWKFPLSSACPSLGLAWAGSGPWTSSLSKPSGLGVPFQAPGRRAVTESFCCLVSFTGPNHVFTQQGEAQA